MGVMRGVGVLGGSLVCLVNCGCIYGTFGGTIKVDNDTDDRIEVVLDRSDLSDGTLYRSKSSVDADHSKIFSYGSFVYNPDVTVEYKGRVKTYKTTVDFFGYDIVHVNTSDFLSASN